MNWLEIDRAIVNMMGIYTERNKLFEDVKKRFSWSDRQVETAVEPLLKRWGWYDNAFAVKPTPAKKKPITKKKVIDNKPNTKASTKAKPKAKKK